MAWRIITLALMAGYSYGSVCLHDDRLEKFAGPKTKREYVVPGYFYDKTLTEIFEEQEGSGHDEFKPMHSNAPGVPPDDHNPENNDMGTESSGPYLMLALLAGILATIIVTRIIPHFPSPLTTLVCGILLAVMQRLGGTPRPDGEHFMNLDSEYIIFGLTPVLILGESLKLDIRLAKRLVVQFIFYGIIGGSLTQC